jgi:hypothetical protein
LLRELPREQSAHRLLVERDEPMLAGVRHYSALDNRLPDLHPLRPYAELATLEVDVLPPKPGEFAPTQPREDSDLEHDTEAILCCGVEEAAELLADAVQI